MSFQTWWQRIANPETFTRRNIASNWLIGEGLEIGALHNPLRVPRAAHVTYVDRMSRADLIREFPELAAEPIVDPKIIDQAEKLLTVPNESQDFLIANHLIEHLENPMAAVETFLRVLRPGGVLYLAIPDMRSTFDAKRQETTVAHLLRDFREGPAWSRREHFDDYAHYVLDVIDVDLRADAVDELIRKNVNIHFHCWSQSGMWSWINALQTELGFPFDIEFYLRRKNEGIFIIRKTRFRCSSLAAA
jgi:SAM-dependent methyltransferase